MRSETMSRPMELTHHIYPRILPHFYAWTKLYGKIFLTWYGPKAQLIVTEPELIKEILSDKDGEYLKPKMDRYAKKIVGDGLVVSNGEKWAKVRKIANHSFHGESLKGMLPAMIASAEMMLERWRHHDGKELEVFEEFKHLTAEVISRTAFGSSYLEGKNIFDMITMLGFIMYRNDLKISIPGIGKYFKSHDDIESDKIEQTIRDSIIGMIKRRQDMVMTGDAESFGSDFLGSLMKANHEADKSNKISVDNIIDECKVFYLAGHETTNGLLAWTILLLAIHTDWQEKARDEVLELFGQENPNPEGLTKLKIMSMILNETLRLYTPAVSLGRKVEREVRLGKLVVPANVELYYSPLSLHHDPEIWGKDAHLFKPERFGEGVAKATKNNPMAFIPFGYGPRICVGLNFAMSEAKIALSMILQRYKFTLSPTYRHSPFPFFTLRPQHGVQIILQQL
ncbi:11-oxo-beta-amyrin 30-oxidase [Bertholletia excelsa]